jgi:uncharacterized C2H2 Zn-finger protein
MVSTRDLSKKFDEMTEESPYKCSLCDLVFRDRQELERHQSEHKI